MFKKYMIVMLLFVGSLECSRFSSLIQSAKNAGSSLVKTAESFLAKEAGAQQAVVKEAIPKELITLRRAQKPLKAIIKNELTPEIQQGKYNVGVVRPLIAPQKAAVVVSGVKPLATLQKTVPASKINLDVLTKDVGKNVKLPTLSIGATSKVIPSRSAGIMGGVPSKINSKVLVQKPSPARVVIAPVDIQKQQVPVVEEPLPQFQELTPEELVKLDQQERVQAFQEKQAQSAAVGEDNVRVAQQKAASLRSLQSNAVQPKVVASSKVVVAKRKADDVIDAGVVKRKNTANLPVQEVKKQVVQKPVITPVKVKAVIPVKSVPATRASIEKDMSVIDQKTDAITSSADCDSLINDLETLRTKMEKSVKINSSDRKILSDDIDARIDTVQSQFLSHSIDETMQGNHVTAGVAQVEGMLGRLKELQAGVKQIADGSVRRVVSEKLKKSIATLEKDLKIKETSSSGVYE